MRQLFAKHQKLRHVNAWAKVRVYCPVFEQPRGFKIPARNLTGHSICFAMDFRASGDHQRSILEFFVDVVVAFQVFEMRSFPFI